MAQGLDGEAVAKIIAATWLTFLMGIAVAGGAILLLDPAGPAARMGLSPTADRLIGGGLLIAVAAFFVWVGTGQRRLTMRGRVVTFPTLPLALAQTGTALVDVAAAASVLWLLLPATVAVGPATFFVAYIAALLVGLTSHAPGGLGAFEATIIAILGLDGQADVVAALILFRLVYYIMPFSVAATTFAVISLRGNRAGAKARAVALAAAVAPIVPPLAAGIAALAGFVLLVSGAMPVPRDDALRLQQFATPQISAVAHLIGSALGVGLIVLAHSLLRMRARAWRFAMGALAVCAITCILRGLDWEEALILIASMALLGLFRRTFDQPGSALRTTPE